MSNFDRAVKVLNDVGEYIDYLEGNIAYVTALQSAGLLMPDVQVIRTPQDLEALAREDADAVVLASEAGAVRSVKALWEMCRAGGMWGLPAVVIATGRQVRAAREALEVINE